MLGVAVPLEITGERLRRAVQHEALRGHVGAVYQLAWAADSRLLASGSKDSTVKVWNVRSNKMKEDLPGHSDEVFALDWSPSGSGAATGGKDRVLKIWRH